MKRAAANTAVLGTAALLALASLQRYTHWLPGSEARFTLERERCHGVARAGRNDCGTSAHACAGRSRSDRDAAEWISLPAGLCKRIGGGRLAADER